MKAKAVNEWDRRDTDYPEPQSEEYMGFDTNEYDDIIYYFNSDNETGIAIVPSIDIAAAFKLGEEERITNKLIDEYREKHLDPLDIEWEEDEGPSPDDLRDRFNEIITK